LWTMVIHLILRHRHFLFLFKKRKEKKKKRKEKKVPPTQETSVHTGNCSGRSVI
jgi:hypothetical protein